MHTYRHTHTHSGLRNGPTYVALALWLNGPPCKWSGVEWRGPVLLNRKTFKKQKELLNITQDATVTNGAKWHLSQFNNVCRAHPHNQYNTNYYYNLFTVPWTLSGTTRVSRYQKGKTRKVKPIWIYCSKRQ